jgi:peptide deformylase
MSLKTIVTEPNAVLHEIAEDVPVADFDAPEIRRLIADMNGTLARALDGVGLAAPQIGVSRKVFLVSEEAKYIDAGGPRERDLKKRPWEQYVFINPRLIRNSRKKLTMAEGCLSVPGKFGEIPRSEKVELSWHDEKGVKHTRGFTGFFARVIQHELDHLDGTLITKQAKRLVDLKEFGALNRRTGV